MRGDSGMVDLIPEGAEHPLAGASGAGAAVGRLYRRRAGRGLQGAARRSRRRCWTSESSRAGEYLCLGGAAPRRDRPRRPAGEIGAARLASLVGHIRDVLVEAIAAGGSSLRDHRQATGELGYFQHSFRVYGREGAPCPSPGCPGTIRAHRAIGAVELFLPGLPDGEAAAGRCLRRGYLDMKEARAAALALSAGFCYDLRSAYFRKAK